MAPDSTDRVYAEISESPLDLQLRSALTRIAQLEPSVEGPYLTVTLDWRPEGSRPDFRPGRQFFAEEGNRLLETLHAHTPEHDTISADLIKIQHYLDEDISREAQGVLFVTSNAGGIFEVMELHVPVENSITVAPTPALARLSWLVDDYQTYAVLLADQKDAILSFISQSKRVGSVNLEGDEYPRRTRLGGFSQQRFQNSVDERIESFAKDVAEQTRIAVGELGIEMVVLAADEVMGSALNRELHQSVQERIVGTVNLDIRASEQDIVAATIPIIEAAERRQEEEIIQRVQDNLGTGEYAVAGPDQVLTALQTGQVMTLVMTDDFQASGWADYTLPVFGTGGKPKKHPAGGDVDSIVEVSLPEELVRLAVQTDADIEIVHTSVPIRADETDTTVPKAGNGMPRSDAARALDDLGGVAAILRFPLAIDQTTAEM